MVLSEVRNMELGESLEDYLESILVLSQKIDPVRSVDVASYLGFSKPSVSHAVKLLEKDGYLQLDKNKYLYLTEEGKRIAQETYRRHKFFPYFLNLFNYAVSAKSYYHISIIQ